jgi:GAF domain-containing protein
MTLLQNIDADAGRTVAELERRLQAVAAERDELVQQQAAAADILKVINASPGDLTPVFDIILEKTHSLCDVASGSLQLYDGGNVRTVAVRGFNERWKEFLRRGYKIDDSNREVMETVHPRHVADMREILDRSSNPLSRAFVEIGGFRTFLGLPLIKEGKAIGRIVAAREEVRPFTEHQIALLQTFADQAVIAIENARLFNETREALERQTATADILKVIASSPSDVQPVFEAVAERAISLLDAWSVFVARFDGELMHLAAARGALPDTEQYLRGLFPAPPDPETSQGRCILQRTAINVADLQADPNPRNRERARTRGFRAGLVVPMLRDGRPIGAISVSRREAGAFADKEVALLQAFADQAVIAIENVRLFDEVQKRTDDLAEALTYQTGSGNILKVIASSPTDVDPVLSAIAESACELCEAHDALVHLRDGDSLRYRAHHGPIPFGFEKLPTGGDPIPFGSERLPINRSWVTGRSVVDKVPVHLHDVLSMEGDEFPEAQRLSRREGTRTILSVPLLRENESIGAIVLRRTEVSPFSEKQIALLRTFADQAVIAIGNVRLFDEVQARTRDLTESLQQQTATSEVLKVISRSAFDLQTVLDTLVGSAARLCDAEKGAIFKRDGELYHWSANFGNPPELEAFAKAHPFRPGRHAVTARVALEGRTFHIADVLADAEYGASAHQKLGNYRTILGVPLLREGEPIGVFVLTREDVKPFTAKQIELVETFADQAVIAIENVRLFGEVQARTSELSESLQFQIATSDVLKVISRSPDALQPVLDVIVEISRELCGSEASTIFLLRDGGFYVTAWSGSMPAHLKALQENPVPLNTTGSILARVHREKRALHIPNVADDPELSQGITGLGGPRALLTVPLMREGQVIGAITLRQSHRKPFTTRQIEAIKAFADQAIIAISNVGLFEQVQQRTRELSLSLDELRTAQDRLVQTEKLASLGQLTAGIAHEIKNPLNFVNNFSALSAELVDELNDALKPAVLDRKLREEIDDLTGMLKGNLEKVVQHGKRADSIVKNMLLHSREGSGEHRPADINAILDESLNLAYHGARAERPGFNIALRRDLDPEAGMAKVYPQEITRVLLNLISNGFYAANKRKEASDGSFEPVLSASTRNLGNAVEIRIRDNGAGIPQEVKEKMFNPFFTTKPAGEGTGLGLSMSHDIVVKQHGGTLDVDTEPGEYTEFIIRLPRNAAAHIQAGGFN